MLVTKELLDEWNARCRKDGDRYSDENLKVIFGGKEGLTPLEVARLPEETVPARDKIWVLLRHEFFNRKELIKVAKNAADRAKSDAVADAYAAAVVADAYAERKKQLGDIIKILENQNANQSR